MLCNCIWEQRGNSFLKKVLFKNLSYWWSLKWLFNKHVSNKALHVCTIVLWNLRVGSFHNFRHQSFHTVCVKGMMQSDHLIKDAAKRPNVWFLIVRLFLANFWRQVIRSSNCSFCTIVCVLKNSSNSKVSNLDFSILSHEYILSFQISVENFSVMNVLDGQCDLNKPI